MLFSPVPFFYEQICTHLNFAHAHICHLLKILQWVPLTHRSSDWHAKPCKLHLRPTFSDRSWCFILFTLRNIITYKGLVLFLNFKYGKFPTYRKEKKYTRILYVLSLKYHQHFVSTIYWKFWVGLFYESNISSSFSPKDSVGSKVENCSNFVSFPLNAMTILSLWFDCLQITICVFSEF